MEVTKQCEFLSRYLLMWHAHLGRQKAGKLRYEARMAYLTRVEALYALDLTKAHNQYQIANEQTNGAFEVFYTEPVDIELWNELCGDYRFELQGPSLGDIARQIFRSVGESEPNENEACVFQLPEKWIDEPHPLLPECVELKLTRNERPRDAFRRYFAVLSESRLSNLGGQELMVSMNEDLGSANKNEAGGISAYNPASFGFRLVNSKDDKDNIVVKMFEGDVEITRVILDLEELSEEEGRIEG